MAPEREKISVTATPAAETPSTVSVEPARMALARLALLVGSISQAASFSVNRSKTWPPTVAVAVAPGWKGKPATRLNSLATPSAGRLVR